MEELVVKLKSVLRDNSSRLCYLTEQLSFDTLTNKLFMKGREKVLSTLEGKILAVLCKNPNQLVKRLAFRNRLEQYRRKLGKSIDKNNLQTEKTFRRM